MSARINKKVVVPLVVGLLVVALVVLALGVVALRRSPNYYRAKGDDAAQNDNWVDAESFYSKAVNRDQGNIELIDLWLDSIYKIVPEDHIKAREYYLDTNSIIRKKKEIRPFEVSFHVDWLSHFLELTRPTPSVADCGLLADEADLMLRAKPATDDDPRWNLAYRFRGIANAYRLSDTGAGVEVETLALEDLNRTLKDNPADSDAAAALVVWHMHTARAIARQNKPSQGAQRLAEGVAFARRHLSDHPNDLQMWLSLANILRVEDMYRTSILGQPSDLQAYTTALARIEELSLTSSDLPWWLAIQTAGQVLSSAETRQEGAVRAIAIVKRALQFDPDQPFLRLDLARYLALQGRPEEALAEYQRLVDRENLPISLAGMQLIQVRPRAIVAQFDIDIDRWRTIDPQDSDQWKTARQEAADRIAAYRELTSDSDVQLLYLEGRFAQADGDPALAAMKLSQFDNSTGTIGIQPNQRMVALLELASALTQTGQAGAAYPYLERANALAGGAYVDAIIAMIDLDIRSQHPERAKEKMAMLEKIDPDHASLSVLGDRIRILEREDPIDDFVAQAILGARDEIIRGNLDAAERILIDQLAQSPGDERLLMDLVRLARQNDDDEKALRYIRMALAGGTDASGRWRILEAIVTNADLRPVLDEIIAEQGLRSDIEKALVRWRLYREYNLTEDATEALEAARKLEPDHPQILEYDFTQALGMDDMAAAQAVVQRAEHANADQINGLTFRGRLELSQGQLTNAISTLIRAADLKPYDGNIWRILGVAYRDSGNYDSAKSAFIKSLDRDPSNTVTLRELARLQLLARDFKDALATITKAHNLDSGNIEIEKLYLELEGVHGDRARIIDLRENVRMADPSGLDNSIALIVLYLLDERFDDARTILEELSPDAVDERLRLARIWSDWHSAQGEIDAGWQVFDDLLAALESPSDSDRLSILLAKGEYLVSQGRLEDGIAVYEEARAVQDAVMRDADRRIGRLRVNMGDLAGAVEPLESALSAKPDSPMLTLQLVNVHLALASQQSATDQAAAEKHRQRAEALLTVYESKNKPTVETALFSGEIAAQRGDIPEADRLFNGAVASFPQDARVYEARARFSLSRLLAANDQSRSSLLKADVEQAMRVNPSNASPLFILVDFANARVDAQTGQPAPDTDLLISTFRRILAIIPGHDQIRRQLVETMYARGEYTKAELLIQEAIDLAPDRAPWYEVRGELQKQRGAKPSEYALAYAEAFQRQPNPSRLLKLTSAWMESDPPAATRALALLNEFDAVLQANPRLQLNKARALFRLDRMSESAEVMRGIAETIKSSQDAAERDELIRAWFNALPFVLPRTDLASTSDACFPDQDDPWSRALLGKTLFGVGQDASDPRSSTYQSEGIDRMVQARDLVSNASESSAQLDLLQQDIGWWLASAYYSQEKWAEAADAWRWVLDANPDHLATLNNLAYVLAQKLDQPAQALEVAQRVYEVAPRDPTMLDTYGYVLLKNGQLDDAERHLRQSLDIRERIVTMLHLGELLLARNDISGARRMYDRARNRAVDQKDVDQIAKIDELIKGLPN